MIRFCFVLSVSGGFSFLFFNGILSTGQRFDVVTFSGKILCDAANLGDSLVGRRRRRGGEGACRVFSQILRSFHPENARGRHAGCWNVFEKITRRNNKESKFTRRLSPQPPAAAEVRRFLKFRAFTHYLVLPSFSLSLRGSFTTKKKPPNQPPFFVFNHSFIDSNRTREGIGIDDAVFWCFFFGQQGRRQRRPQVLHGSRLLFRSVAPGDAQRHGAHAEGQRTQGIVFFSCVLIVFYCYYFTDIIEPHCAPFGRRSFRDFVSRRVLCDCSLRVTRRLWFGLC